MKKIFSKILTMVFRKSFVLWTIAFLICVSVFMAYATYCRQQFEKKFEVYQNVAALQQNAAFVPGASSNPLRADLNQILARVLTKNTTAHDRLQLSAQGFDLIQKMNKEVDVMGDSAKPVTEAIGQLKVTMQNPGNSLHRGDMNRLISLAEKQVATIEDIRGLSYRADFEMTQIFKHLTDDHGELSNTYTKELNDQLPAIEEEFNKRENSYADLESSMAQVQQLYAKIAGTS